MTLEQWVGRVLDGDAAVATEVQDFLSEAAPAGSRYEVRLNNGVAPLVLLPTTRSGSPNGAAGAEAPLYPNWRTFATQVTTGSGFPGQEVANVAGQLAPYSFTSSATVQCVKAPDGSSTGPGGATWVSVWKTQAGRIPSTIPLGVWAGYTDAGCTVSATYARVAPASLLPTCGTAPPSGCNYPIYGLQMVVWFGA